MKITFHTGVCVMSAGALAFVGLLGFSAPAGAVVTPAMSCSSCQQGASGATPAVPLPAGQTTVVTPTGGQLLDNGVVVASFTKNASGVVTDTVVEGRPSNVQYDASNRIVAIKEPSGAGLVTVMTASYNADGTFASILDENGTSMDVSQQNAQILQIKRQKPVRPAPSQPPTPPKPISYCQDVYNNCNQGCVIEASGCITAAYFTYLGVAYACKINITCHRIARASLIAAYAYCRLKATNCQEKCSLDFEACINGY